MMDANLKNDILQEGTALSGESLPEACKLSVSSEGEHSLGSPTYSAGGKNLQISGTKNKNDSGKGTNLDMTNDLEVMRGESKLRYLSESDSACSMVSVSSVEEVTAPARAPAGRKRRRHVEPSNDGSEEEGVSQESASVMDDAHLASTTTQGSKRGRGRPPSSGKYVGLGKAKSQLNAEKQRQLLLDAEAEIANKTKQLKRPNSTKESFLKAAAAGIDVSDDETVQLVCNWVEVINNVAAKSKNLKGTFQGALKEAASNIKGAVEKLATRSTNEETARLQRDNICLKAEVADLRKEITELRADLKRVQEEGSLPLVSQPSPARTQTRTQTNGVPEELVSLIMNQVGNMVNARIEGLQDRLLPKKQIRPPLASDRPASDRPDATRYSTIASSGEVKANQEKASASVEKRGKKPKVVWREFPIETSSQLPRDISSTLQRQPKAWTEVVKKGKKKSMSSKSKPVK